jgi:general secretion pathway protein L
MKLLLIRLHTNLKTCDWFLKSTAEEIKINVELSSIPNISEDYKIIAFVPNIHINLKQTHLATKQTKQLTQAIPYALEEFLIDEINSQHFAFYPIKKGESQQVAIVDHKKINDWLTLLAENNIFPSLLIPEIYLLPVLENSWSMHADNNQILIRCDNYSGLAVRKNDWSHIFKIILKESHKKPEKILLYSNEKNSLLNTDIPVEIVPLPHIFEWFNQSYPNLFFINLLQGRFKTKLRRSKTLGVWKMAAILFITLVILNIFSEVSAYLLLHHQYHHLQKQIEKIYYSAFPTATSIIEPKTRFERELKAYSSAYSEHGFLSIISILRAAFQVPDIKINHLNFKTNILHIEVLAKNFQTLQEFDNQLKKTQLLVKQLNRTTSGDVIKAEYSLEERS